MEESIHSNAALSWVRRSIEATAGRGSAHSWHPLLGWAKAYPETTGYLIETLLTYAERNKDESLRKLALNSTEWLVSQQLPSGAFPGLLAGSTQPSVFNTSQILFGLKAALPCQPALRPVLDRTVNWLLNTLEPDFSWKKAAFVPGFVPTYYTRAVWALLVAEPEAAAQMRAALHFYAERILPNYALRDAGFRKGETAFTHTLAYALEGFWEAAWLLCEHDIQEKIKCAMTYLVEIRAQGGGRTAGRYDERWQGDYRFVCVTGNCQLAILAHKIGVHMGEPVFLEAAQSFFREILPAQKLGANKNTFGALPGSIPFWGAYLPFRYPNWAAKFFLDAMLLLHPSETQ